MRAAVAESKSMWHGLVGVPVLGGLDVRVMLRFSRHKSELSPIIEAGIITNTIECSEIPYCCYIAKGAQKPMLTVKAPG